MTETTVESGTGRAEEVGPPEVGEFGKGFFLTPTMAFERLRDTGILWYINRVAFHPRGFALALDFDDDGNARGWAVQATDGTEMFTFSGDDADGSGTTEDAMFRKVEAMLNEARLAANQKRQPPVEADQSI